MSQHGIINALVTVLVLLAALAVALWAIQAVLYKIQSGIREHRRKHDQTLEGWRYRSKIELLDRWCCWHFPIIEDVCAFLLEQNEDIDHFRERMKAKYGDRERERIERIATGGREPE